MNMEQNKILAALLVAGITALLAGFISKNMFHHKPLEKEAFPIAVVETASALSGAAAAAGPGDIGPLLASADVGKGESMSKACRSCHTFEKGGEHRLGPALFGSFGRGIGGASGYGYSDAMKAKGGSWDAESLNQFLYKPRAFVVGTKMTFDGIKNDADRAAMIAWMKTLK